jgi:hypothetical protein
MLTYADDNGMLCYVDVLLCHVPINRNASPHVWMLCDIGYQQWWRGMMRNDTSAAAMGGRARAIDAAARGEEMERRGGERLMR